MTVEQLYKILGMSMACGHSKSQVCITLDEPSIGGSAVSYVTRGFDGFDWDSGKFILTTEDKVIRR